jgi:hypothetical protein
MERQRQNARAIARSTQKPSLTAIVSALSTTKKSNSSNFAAFCSSARMQGNTSLRVRRACYYLKTIASRSPALDSRAPSPALEPASSLDSEPSGSIILEPASSSKPEGLLERILGGDQFVMEALGRMPPITTPDVAVLRLFLEDVQMDSETPACLRMFKDAVGIVGHNWTTVSRCRLFRFTPV